MKIGLGSDDYKKLLTAKESLLECDMYEQMQLLAMIVRRNIDGAISSQSTGYFSASLTLYEQLLLDRYR